jgi:hypothetical protein
MMRIALAVVLILGLCTASFAARPDRGRITPAGAVDNGQKAETVVWWPPNAPTEFRYLEDTPVVLGPQYCGAWYWFKVLCRLF